MGAIFSIPVMVPCQKPPPLLHCSPSAEYPVKIPILLALLAMEFIENSSSVVSTDIFSGHHINQSIRCGV
jgi:hypothetical protein